MALIQINMMSENLLRTVTMNAVVPFDKLPMPGQRVEQRRPFRTLYLLHGILGDHTDWTANTRIQRWAEERDLAVVMPAGENRFYLDSAATGEGWGRFIGQELPRKMQRLFGLSAAREDNFLAGLSMGGYGALVNGLRYKEQFSRIAGLSSALVLDELLLPGGAGRPCGAETLLGPAMFGAVFGKPEALPGSDRDYYALAKTLAQSGGELPQIYLCCGLEDSLLEPNRRYARFLKEQGFSCTYIEGPGGHEWDFWDRNIRDILDWLPLGEIRAGRSSGNVG